MPFQFWGVSGTFDIALPEQFAGYLLLLVYSLAALALVIYFGRQLRKMRGQQWALIAALASLSFLLSQLFPFDLSSEPQVALTLFAAFPALLAGAILNPLAALIVGFLAGLGRSIGQTHVLFDAFHMAFIAVLAAVMMGQNYRGRLYGLLRQPAASGVLANSGLVLLTLLATLATVGAGDGYVTALDRALITAAADFWPALIQGIVGGGLVSLVLVGAPHLRPRRKLVVSPSQRSLRKRLLGNFAVFAIGLTIFLVAFVFYLSVNVSTKLVVNQMAHNTKLVSAKIPGFQDHLQNLLAQFGDTESLLVKDAAENVRALKQLQRADTFYRRILLVDSEQSVSASYPENGTDVVLLSEWEKEAVAEVFLTNAPNIATADTVQDEEIVSFVVPVLNRQGAAEAALIGRVPQLSLASLIVGLDGTVGQGTGFVVDDHSSIVAHSDASQLLQDWQPSSAPLDYLKTSETEPGIAYRARKLNSGSRELVYYTTVDDRAWKVVTSVPYAVVMNLAISIGGPLALVLLLVMGVFYANLAVVGRDISRPISELVDGARTIAAGGRWSPPSDVYRSDEIGQLGQAFGQMHRSNNRRLRELSLLLDVSHNVATNIDINQGMPSILRGALRGTGAAGARAVVLNPSGTYPLTFGEGPASEAMSVLDRAIMTRMRHSKELILATPAQMRSALKLEADTKLPARALVAIPLHFHGRFQGILWLGFRQTHGFDPAVRTLLQTLAGQAAVLVENARLFAVAEGGRRRLAAVLASTADAFIVTDPTDRVLLINRAMETAFDLKASDIVGRPVADVLNIRKLIQAITGEDDKVRNLEIRNNEGKTFYSSVAPIINNDGQALGRVAVLHDITHLKQIDKMKSDFVATVSHDLRNPLTFMRGYANMLPMVGDVNDKQGEYIDRILKGVDQMFHLVENLLDLGRIEAGIEVRLEDIDVSRLLSELCTDYSQHAYMAGIELKGDFEAGLPTVKGDTSLIRQAVTNLITNGIKYAPNSGVMLVKADLVDDEVVIRVQDQGPGIPKQAQLRLFEKFYRVRSKENSSVKGAGLGLAIVKSIVERHGGLVWCDSEEGQGSTFSISLPQRPSSMEKRDA